MTVKRSPIQHRFLDQNYVIAEHNAYDMASLLSNEKAEKESIKRLALCDLSSFNRAGFRGRNIAPWFEQQHNIVLPAVNQALMTEDGLLVSCLSHTEVLLLEDIESGGDVFTSILDKTGTESISSVHPEIYYLPRQTSHSCFFTSGEHCARLFSKLCGVDLRTGKFSNMSIVQTSLARASVIIIRRDLNETPGYFILNDSSLTEYLWDCLLDAMQEFEGNIVGLSHFIKPLS